jgi:hypothetical protein
MTTWKAIFLTLLAPPLLLLVLPQLLLLPPPGGAGRRISNVLTGTAVGFWKHAL